VGQAKQHAGQLTAVPPLGDIAIGWHYLDNRYEAGRSPVTSWRRFVAVGDSFTEGLDDRWPSADSYRGWADLVAGVLAGRVDGFAYANLAVRGRLFGRVVDEQVPPAVAMRPDLVSFAAGGNDVLRRRFDPVAMVTRFDTTIGRIRASGADVILFRFADLTARLPGQRMIAPRVALLNAAVGETAARYGATLVDMSADDEFDNPVLWSIDRLHLSSAGHRRVAAHVLTGLGVPPHPDWWTSPARPAPLGWLAARTADAAWVGRHLAPWLKRRLAGRSSGDDVTAKRPTLTPVDLRE
jgi:lysophospholipase L1-like esterase